jgi:hypothetical protein
VRDLRIVMAVVQVRVQVTMCERYVALKKERKKSLTRGYVKGIGSSVDMQPYNRGGCFGSGTSI